MAKREYKNGVVGWAIAIERDIPRIAETDRQFAHFGRIGKRLADFRRDGKQRQVVPERARRPDSSARIFIE